MPRSNLMVVRQWAQTGPVKSPRVPASWTVIPESNGWSTLYPNARGGALIHARCVAVSGTNGLFVLFGPRNALDRVAALVTNSWPSIAALRADNGTAATQVKAAWIDDRSAQQTSQGEPLVKLRSRMAGLHDDDAETAVP